MEAPLSTCNRLSSTSGWTEVTGSVGLLLLEGGRPPDSGTFEGSGAVSGLGPDLEPWGDLSPLLLESGRSPCGSSRTTLSWLGTCWDATSASSVGWGEVAGGSEFTSDESREPLDDSSSPVLGGLHRYIRHKGKLCNKGTLRVTFVSEHLRSRRALGPVRPLLFAVVGVGGVVRRKGLPLLRS